MPPGWTTLQLWPWAGLSGGRKSGNQAGHQNPATAQQASGPASLTRQDVVGRVPAQHGRDDLQAAQRRVHQHLRLPDRVLQGAAGEHACGLGCM